MEKEKEGRLMSLDALRGFDMLWISSGDTLIHALKDFLGWGWLIWFSSQLEHVEWNGFHFYDLIFPLFLFLSGVTMPFSFGRQLEKGISKGKIIKKVLIRSITLVVFGVIYNGLWNWHFSQIRFASVLGQIGIAYFFAALIFLNTNWKQQIYWVVGILLCYWAIQVLIPVPGYGAGVLTLEGSINGYIDRMFMPGKLYLVVHDPEGWLVKIPATATALLGGLTGYFIKSEFLNKKKKALTLFIAAIVFLGISLIYNLVLPINKNLWTSSFVLHTAGWSILLLSIFYFIIDVMNYRRWAFFFIVIGMNSITIYMLNSLFNFDLPVKHMFGGFIAFFDKGLQAIILPLLVIIFEWLILYFFYKKKIFLKV